MSSLKQNIRSVLADVETFLVETLKSVKLNSSAKDHKDRLLEKIHLLLDEIPGSASSQQDSNASGGSLKISGGGDSGSGGNSSSNLQNMSEDDNAYADNLPKLAASDLKNKLQTGMLDKKKKSGFKSWEPLYCVVSGNTFYMYKKQGDSKQKEAFCLTGYGFSEAPGLEKDAAKKEMCFELTKPGAPTYQFRAGSKEGMVIWKEAITKGIQMAGTAADDGGEAYDDVGPSSQGAHYEYSPLETAHIDDDDEEIYDELADPPPSFTAPPIPRPSLPLPPTPDEVRQYANLASSGYTPAHTPVQHKEKTASLNRTSGSKFPRDPSPEFNIFRKTEAGEGIVFPSAVKKDIMKMAAEGGEKPQKPPPMVNIYKDIPPVDNTPSSPQGGKASTTATTASVSAPSGNSKGPQTAASQAKPKSPPASSARNQLPSASYANYRGVPRSNVVQQKGGQSSSPPASGKSDVQTSSRSSPPPPERPDIKDLKKMFEKK